MLIPVGILFGFYFVLIVLLIIGWRPRHNKAVSRSEERFVTVLVPFRNEEKNLQRLLEALSNQSYPVDKWETILINDASSDNSVEVIERFISNSTHANIRLIHSDRNGKKQALTLGVSNSRGEIILTTDADCIFGRGWIAGMESTFLDQTKMIVGPVRFHHERSLWSKMMQLEFASLIGTSAATLAFGKPTMCNGANLAFRKEAFLEVRGYESNVNVASGDDELLMRKISLQYDNPILYSYNKEAIVSTDAPGALADFVNQRIRWAGKWRYNVDVVTKLLAVLVVFFHFGVIAAWFFIFSGQDVLFGALLITKMTGEFIFLTRVTAWLGNKWSWSAFLLWQILYPLYAVSIGIGSLSFGYHWKGRSYQAVTES